MLSINCANNATIYLLFISFLLRQMPVCVWFVFERMPNASPIFCRHDAAIFEKLVILLVFRSILRIFAVENNKTMEI